MKMMKMSRDITPWTANVKSMYVMYWEKTIQNDRYKAILFNEIPLQMGKIMTVYNDEAHDIFLQDMTPIHPICVLLKSMDHITYRNAVRVEAPRLLIEMRKFLL